MLGAPDMRRVAAARALVERVETYDALTRFELGHADLLHDSALAEASSDDEPHLLADKLDAAQLEDARALCRRYEEAVKATEFAAPVIAAPPAAPARSALEGVIEAARAQGGDEEALEQGIAAAAARTLTLPPESLPALLAKKPARQLQPPRRLLRSQLDPIFQASPQTEKPAELEAQAAFLARRQPNRLEQTRPREFPPCAHQAALSKRNEAEWQRAAAAGAAEATEERLRAVRERRAEAEAALGRTRARRPRLSGQDGGVADRMRLERNVARLHAAELK